MGLLLLLLLIVIIIMVIMIFHHRAKHTLWNGDCRLILMSWMLFVIMRGDY